MPYINQNRRPNFDPHIEKLINLLAVDGQIAKAGDVNYVISRIVAGSRIGNRPLSYDLVSDAIRVFSDAAAEMRRRLLDKCEDGAIERNGDIPEYWSK